MEYAIKAITVFAIAIVELAAAVPAGFAMRLNPVVTGVLSASGAVAGVLIIVSLGERIRAWLTGRRKDKGVSGRFARAQRLWDRYGVVGLGLLAPLLTGVPLAAALGLLFGASTARLVLWTSAGAVLWSAALTVAGSLGAHGLKALFF